MERKTADMSKMTDTISRQENEIAKLVNEVAWLKDEKEKLEKANKQKKQNIGELIAKIDNIQNAREVGKELYEKLQEDHRTLGENLEKVKKMNSDLNARLLRVVADKKRLTKTLRHRDSQLTKLNDDWTHEKKRADAFADAHHSKEVYYEDLLQRRDGEIMAQKHDLQQSESDRIDMSQKLESALRNAEKAQNELESMLKEKYALRDSFQMIMEERNEFERKNKGLLKVIDNISDLI